MPMRSANAIATESRLEQRDRDQNFDERGAGLARVAVIGRPSACTWSSGLQNALAEAFQT